MNKTPHSNLNGKLNVNAIKNGGNRLSDNECGNGQYFSSSDEANSRYTSFLDIPNGLNYDYKAPLENTEKP